MALRVVIRVVQVLILTAFVPQGTICSSSLIAIGQVLDHRFQSRPQLIVQLGHGLFFPDFHHLAAYGGQYLLTSAADNTPILWDLETGKVLRRLQGHSGWVTSLELSPNHRHALTSSYDGTTRIWNLAAAVEVGRFHGFGQDYNPDGTAVLLIDTPGTTAHVLDVSTGEERARFAGHTGILTSAVFSSNGSRVLSASRDSTARLWDAETGRELMRFIGHTGSVVHVSFSPDEETILTSSADRTARIWSTQTGNELHSFDHIFLPYRETQTPPRFSPDGLKVLTLARDTTVRIWNVSTGLEEARIHGHESNINSACFSPGGAFVLSASSDSTARIWDAATGSEIQRFAGDLGGVSSATFSSSGDTVLTTLSDGTVRLWAASTGSLLQTLAGRAGKVWSAEFSSDGDDLLTSWDGGASIWDGASGAVVRRFSTALPRVSPHGEYFLKTIDDTLRLLDMVTEAEIRQFEDQVATERAEFSPNGKLVLASSGRKARLFEVSTGLEIWSVEHGANEELTPVAFSPDGQRMLTAGNNSVRIWDVTNGIETLQFRLDVDGVWCASFSPDSRQILIGGVSKERRGIAYLFDAVTGKELLRLAGHGGGAVVSVGFSPDGRQILTGGFDGQALLFEANNGRELRRFVGHRFQVRATFSTDGRHVLTSSWDGTTRLWDPATGRERCRLISFKEGTWAVVDSFGRFDASYGGEVNGLHWVLGDEIIELSQLKDRYYDPGLLAKHLGFNEEPLRKVQEFNRRGLELYPAVKLAVDGDSLRVNLKSRGGGIGRVAVFVNGKEVASDARGPALVPQADTLLLTLELAGNPLMLPDSSNSVEVVAYNADGSLASRGTRIRYRARTGAPVEPPSLWAVVVGVSDYQGTALDLRYAAKDAADFARALEIGGHRLFGPERTHITLLSTSEGHLQPTKANLVEALEQARAAHPTDILVVYLAGHGINHGGLEGDYYYLTREALSGALTDSAVRHASALSSDELTELIKAVPALKQVLILDTCGAGRLVEEVSTKRDIPSSQLRSFERMKDRTGLYVLAGSAADAVSYETSRYGQGLLTYSLLSGMRGAALREGSFVDVSRLFDYATDRVPELASGIGGIQRPVLAVPRGGASFDVGQIIESDQTRIPLEVTRPMFLRTSFQEEALPVDRLGISEALDEALMSAQSRGRQVVYVDASSFAEAYQLSGRYRAEDTKVNVNVYMLKDDEVLAQFEVKGTIGREEDLAELIIASALAQIDK